MTRLARRAEEFWVRLSAAGLRRLPARTVVALRERLRQTVRLDYPRRKLLLSAGSIAVLGRARACQKEPETVAWIERVLQPGEVLYDIGANVGAYALVAWAASDGEATVVAFEPSVLNYANLVENVRLNGCGARVLPLPVAVGDASRLDFLHPSRLTPGAALHRLGGPNGAADSSAQAVLVGRLDDLVDTFALPPPHHLKIDVDGSELPVLRGAPTTLAGTRLRSILIEVADADAEEISEVLGGHGFELCSRHPRSPASGLSNLVYEKR